MSRKRLERRREPQQPIESKTVPIRSSGARNAAQQEAIRKYQTHDILFLIGPAGSGKTHAAVAIGYGAMCAEEIDRIIVTRPAVECDDEEWGHLPGELKDKQHPWLMPFQDVLRTIVGEKSASILRSFETCPLAFVRGRTFSRCVAILDEAQNASVAQLKAYLTRIGEGGKIIICADPKQSDRRGGGDNLIRVANACEKAGVAAVIRFTDDMIVRSPHIAKILTAFDGLGS